MNIYHTKSELLLLYLKKHRPSYTKLTSFEEVYKYAPRWVPGRGVNKVCLMYRGDLRDDIKLPKWEGELYVLGECDVGDRFDLDLYNLVPQLGAFKKLFTEQCWYFLEKRFKRYPLNCEWELSVLINWYTLNKPKELITTEQVKDILQIVEPKDYPLQRYKRIWGTKEGAMYLYSLEDSALWLLLHHCLKDHLERVNANLTLELQILIERCENGSPIREEAIMLNSLIGQYFQQNLYNQSSQSKVLT